MIKTRSVAEVHSILGVPSAENWSSIEYSGQLPDPSERQRITTQLLGNLALPTTELSSDEHSFRCHAARRLTILQNIEHQYARVQSGEDIGLWPNQIPPYLHALAFISQTESDVTDSANLARQGYIELPTAFGKTAIMAKVFEAAGVGKQGPAIDSRPIKGLHLVPTIPILEKAASDQGLAKFLPGVKVSAYYGRRKDTSGDIIVTTYDSLRQEATQRMIAEAQIDLVTCDEAHHLLSKRAREAVEWLHKNTIMLGFTATTSYSPSRSLQSILKHKIFEMDIREAVAENYVSGAQLLGLWTGAKLRLSRDRNRMSDFSNKELHPLVQNAERNGLILDMAVAFAEQGRKVVIPCIAGDDNLHARILAKLGSQRIIVDPITRQKRPLTSAAVYQDNSKREEILTAWNDGQYDILTYTGLLNEGWDSENVDAMIMARPTTSELLARQRIGRGLRKSERNALTVYVELIDDIPAAPLYTIWHAFGEDIKSDEVTLYAEHKPQQKRRQQRQKFQLESLPPSIQAAHDKLSLVPIRESILSAIEGGYPKPPAEWHMLTSVAAELEVGTPALSNYLQNNGFSCEIFRTPGAPYAYFAPPEAIAFLKAANIPAVAPRNFMTAKRLSRLHGTTRERIMSGVKELELQGKEFRARSVGHIAIHYTPEEQTKLETWLKETFVESPEGVSVHSLGEELGIGRESIRYFLANKGEDITMLVAKSTGMKNAFCSHAQAELVRKHFGAESVAPDTVRSLQSIGTSAGNMRLSSVREAVKALRLEDKVQKYRHVPPGAKNARHDSFVEEIYAQQLITYLQEQRIDIPDDTISVGAYAKDRRCNTERVLSMLREKELPILEIQRGKTIRRYLPPRAQYVLDRALGYELPAWFNRNQATNIINCRDEEFEAIINYCRLQQSVVDGEEQVIATPAVTTLYNYSVSPQLYHRNFKSLEDMRNALLTVFNTELSHKDIHTFIRDQGNVYAKQYALLRGSDRKLQFYYEREFANQLVQRLSYHKPTNE